MKASDSLIVHDYPRAFVASKNRSHNNSLGQGTAKELDANNKNRLMTINA